jgi:hypothetical protein
MSIIKRGLIYVVIAAHLCACSPIPVHVSAPQDDHVEPGDRAAGAAKGAVAAGLGAGVGALKVAGPAAPLLLPIVIGIVVIGGVVGGLYPHQFGVGEYRQHGRGYNQKEYKISHILVGTEDEAKAIAADLKQGKDFGTMAKEKSKDSGSSQNGGELGWFYLDVFSNQFVEAARNLKKGEISKPVQTEFGWHIIKLDDVRSANSTGAPK